MSKVSLHNEDCLRVMVDLKDNSIDLIEEENARVVLLKGDCLEVMRGLEDCSIDSIVTDPPYEIGFMGKGWDTTGIAYNVKVWEEALRVLKPGGHLLAFSSARTYHRMAVAIEDAGFQIRDMIEWIYGSGFPKSLNISKGIEAKIKTGKSNSRALRQVEQDGDGEEYTLKGRNNGIMGEERVYNRKEFTAETDLAKQWDGWGTQLKPAHEPIVVARKPIEEKTIVENVLKYGTGGINIDGTRIELKNGEDISVERKEKDIDTREQGCGFKAVSRGNEGRFPANLILSEDIAPLVDEQSGISKSTKRKKEDNRINSNKSMFIDGKHNPKNIPTDSVGASRFFKNIEIETPFYYCPKASKKERGEDNIHPTVKPIKLMEYLITLITPHDGTVMDLFMGSGSTGVAAVNLNRYFIGIEMDEEYFKIAEARIKEVEEKAS